MIVVRLDRVRHERELLKEAGKGFDDCLSV